MFFVFNSVVLLLTILWVDQALLGRVFLLMSLGGSYVLQSDDIWDQSHLEAQLGQFGLSPSPCMPEPHS